MISVGIDGSKGKTTVCVLKPYGEIVCSPFEMQHMERNLDDFHNLLQKLDGELRIVMPGIRKMFNSWNEANGKDKFSDYVERFWHFDLITSMGLEKFKEEHFVWAKERNTTEADKRLKQSMN